MNERIPPIDPAVLLEHAEFLRALARSLIRDPASADDIEQETWLRALQRRPVDASSLRGWLATVMHNVVRNRARASSRREQRERDAQAREFEAPSWRAAEQADTLRHVVRAVLALEEPFRSTVLTLYFEGCTAREFAQREGVPEVTVRSRHSRALAKLRERLDASHGSRESWCAALANLAGLDASVGASGGAFAGFGLAAALLVALASVGLWLALRSNEPSVELGAATGAVPQPSPQELVSGASTATAERSATSAGERWLRLTVLDALSELAGGPTAPAADVEVLVEQLSGEVNAPESSTLELRTDAQGRVEVQLGRDGDALRRVHIAVPGSASHRALRKEWNVDGAWESELDLVRPRHGVITLEVQTRDETPLPNVAAAMTDKEAETWVRTGPVTYQQIGDHLMSGGMGYSLTPELESVTDNEGLARFGSAKKPGTFRLKSNEWTPVHYVPPSILDQGGWTPARMVVTATGRVRIRVTNHRGDGLPSVEIRLSRAKWEHDTFDTQQGAPESLGARSARTDERGEVVFEQVWSEVDLQVTAVRGDVRFEAAQRSYDGRLIGQNEDGLALRVPPRGELTLEARFEASCQLELRFAHSAWRSSTCELATSRDQSSTVVTTLTPRFRSRSSSLRRNLLVLFGCMPQKSILWRNQRATPEH